MTPKTLEYENGRVIITPEAFAIPEYNAIIKKYGDDEAIPYLQYVRSLTHPESPYIHQSEEEMKDNAIYDITHTLGEFDPEEPLLLPAIKKERETFYTRTKKYYESVCRLMDKTVTYSETVEVNDDNVDKINKMVKEVGATMRSFKDAEKQVDDELRTKMKGKSVLGDY